MPAEAPQSQVPEQRTAVHRTSQPTIIAAEANLLRLPLFALQTKGLRSLEGFESQGRLTRNGQSRNFYFRTARSTATLYPGPLSRSAHLAFLSLITERGLPIQNPITWTWRELCRRMETSPSGRGVQHLKRAIESTAGLTIFSRDAVYSKPAGASLQTRAATHLYESVVFVNEPLPDGQMADTNYLWFSPWYLENLNSLFTAPLDHELWRYLDKKSTIASRLYEFLLINFFSGTPQLRIHYPRLAQFLPIRPERYLSDAQRQLEPALGLLRETRLTGRVRWQKRAEDLALLEFDRGNRLQQESRQRQIRPDEAPELDSQFSVTEIRQDPDAELINSFYRLWRGETQPLPQQRPSEILLARQLLSQHGRSRVKAMLPLVVDRLREKWPDAKTFLAIESYLPQVLADFDVRELQRARRQKRLREQQQEARLSVELASKRKQFEARWLPVWNELPAQEQESLRKQIESSNPMFRLTPGILLSRCLEALAQRQMASRNDSGTGTDAIANGA